MHPSRPSLAGALALGAATLLPVTLAGLGLQWAAGASLLTPAALVLTLLPLVGAGLAGVGAHRLRLRERALEAARADRDALEQRRRDLADEAASLQGVELGLLADLEEAEAELDAHADVLGSLVQALSDTLVSIDAELAPEAARAPDGPVPRVVGQVGELLELVRDVETLITPSPTLETEPAFDLRRVVAEELDPVEGLSWELDAAAPRWTAGGEAGLRTTLRAAMEAVRESGPGPWRLALAWVARGGSTGLRIAWGEGEDHLADGVGARLAEALGAPPVLGTRAEALTWWQPEAPDPGASVVPEALPPARVMVAADDPASRARLRRLLGHMGLDVGLARTGTDALVQLETLPADLLLLDLHQDSLPTLRRLRAHPDLARIPALVLSPDLDNLVLLDPPGDPDLTRAVRQEALVDDLEEALRHHGSQPAQGRCPRRILALETRAGAAAALVRAGADLGWEVVVVATLAALEARPGPWDLVLVDGTVLGEIDPVALPDAPSLSLVDHPTAGARMAARAAGLDDATRRPRDATGLARLLSLAVDPRAGLPPARSRSGGPA
jgi:CheY-like chemotaxis protein